MRFTEGRFGYTTVICLRVIAAQSFAQKESQYDHGDQTRTRDKGMVCRDNVRFILPDKLQ